MSNGFRTVITFIFFVCSITIIIVVLVLVVKERKRAHIIQNEIYTLEQEKKRYEHENMELQDRVAYLQSDHSYEKEAKKLNYKKQGEHVVIVRRSYENNNDEGHILGATSDDEQKKTHYQIWLNYFFNKNI